METNLSPFCSNRQLSARGDGDSRHLPDGHSSLTLATDRSEYFQKSLSQGNDPLEGLHHASPVIVTSRCSSASGSGLGSSSTLVLSQSTKTPNEISFMQESVDLQWFLEDGYQRESEFSGSQAAPRSVFEGSLLQSSSSSYTTPPSASSYEVIARNIDANLAEIDMETFRSEDINAILTIPGMFRESGTQVRQQAGEEFASVSDSLIRELESDSVGQRSCSEGLTSVYVEDEPLFSPSKDDGDSCGRQVSGFQSRLDDGTSSSARVTGISVDSLDMSSLEENTNQLVMRCAEHDKNKYTIAFEESLSSNNTFTSSDPPLDEGGDEVIEKKPRRLVSGARVVQVREADVNGLARSEYLLTTWGRLRRHDQDRENCNNGTSITSEESNADCDCDASNNATKQSQSLPNIVQVASGLRNDYRRQMYPNREFLPLFDLQSSHSSQSHSSNSESPPRSLIRLFIQNRASPTSSGQISSTSLGSQSQESPGGSISSSSTPTKAVSFTSIGALGQRIENNNNLDNGSAPIGPTTRDGNEDDTFFEDSLIIEERTSLAPPKTAFNRMKQASPIKEEEEPLSDSSRADVTMTSESDEVATGPVASNQGFQPLFTFEGRRSSSMDRFVNTTSRQPLSFNSFNNANKEREKALGKGSELSPTSSGYSSNRGSNEWLKRTNSLPPKTRANLNVTMTMTKTASTQVPVHIQDKEVQTSCASDRATQFVVKETPSFGSSEREVRQRQAEGDPKKSFYVCYPNYSLPDLSFLNELQTTSSDPPKAVYFSPTKLRMPSREPTLRQRDPRGGKRGARPKSYTDFETLSKQNFTHIKDWDSLNVLLPNEFKALVEKVKGMNRSQPPVKPEKPECAAMGTQPSSPGTPSQDGVRFRIQKRMARRGSSNEKCNCGANSGQNKRFSLQEPFAGIEESIRKRLSEEMGYQGMSRSETMPVCYQCHWHHHNQHYHSNHCCHHCCHSPLSTPGACMSPTSATASRTRSRPYVDGSIDKLCALLSMDNTLKEVTNLISGQGSRTCSPTKPWGTIVEQNEDAEACRERRECRFFDTTEDSLLSYSSFKELQKQWETLAKTPTNLPNTSPSPSPSPSPRTNPIRAPLKSPAPVKKSQHKEVAQGLKLGSKQARIKPQIAAKPAHAVKRPGSSPPMAGKIGTGTGTGTATRPTSLNTHHFKSMIPIPKGSKSPPGAKSN